MYVNKLLEISKKTAINLTNSLFFKTKLDNEMYVGKSYLVYITDKRCWI